MLTQRAIVAQVGVGMGVVFTLARIASVWGRPVKRFGDTTGYLDLDLTGSATRFWPVPLVYSIVHDDMLRVGVQVTLSIAAWLYLAWAVNRVVLRLPLAAPVCVLLLGATPQAARWDLTILSESIGLSIAVATFATWLLAWQRRTPGWTYAAAGASVVFGATRPPQVPVLVAITVAAGITALRHRDDVVLRRATAVLIVGCAWGAVQLANNQNVSTLNLYSVMSDRVILNAERRDWFIGHGMPWKDSYDDSNGYANRNDLPADLIAYLDLPAEQQPPALMLNGGFEFARWAKSDGWPTYARFLISHPLDTLADPAARFDPMLNPADRDLLPLSPRPALPRALFGYWQAWLAGALALIVAATRVGRRPQPAMVVPLAALAICVPWFYLVALGSGIEHPRHAITVAVMLRVSALIMALIAWDSLGARRSSGESRDDGGGHAAAVAEFAEDIKVAARG